MTFREKFSCFAPRAPWKHGTYGRLCQLIAVEWVFFSPRISRIFLIYLQHMNSTVRCDVCWGVREVIFQTIFRGEKTRERLMRKGYCRQDKKSFARSFNGWVYVEAIYKIFISLTFHREKKITEYERALKTAIRFKYT